LINGSKDSESSLVSDENIREELPAGGLPLGHVT